ncbi:fer-1-like protein 6 [Anopheles maculipalpis]|uniref:fer-1-like protein 6 n=1 Tax=Anopheles maculipalpis TaxID=1496333 RepID=UPI0021595983|nr:fer-1-like protein 6 [Anopheles maculipalpis]
MSRPGHSSVDAIARFNMLHYLQQANPSGPSGLQCGKRCTTLPRSIQCNHSCPDLCGCIYAKLDYELEIGTEEQQELIIPEDPSRKVADVQWPIDNHPSSKYVHCKVHVYQGRIFTGFLDTEQFKVKLTVLFENDEQALSSIPSTLSPCWNESVEFLNVPFTMSSMANNELSQKCTIMFILQCREKETERSAIGWLESSIKLLQPEQQTVDEGTDFGEQPKPYLQWIPLYLKGLKIAEILVSSNVLEVRSSLQKSDGRTETERLLVHNLPPEIAPTLRTFRVRVLFVGLRQIHLHSCRKMKKSRILITLGDVSIMSGLSGTAYGSSANFPEGYENRSVRLPINPNYWPLMILKHIDCTDEKHMKIIGNAIVNASELSVDSSIPSESVTDNSTIIEISQEENETEFPVNIANINPLNIASHWSYARDVIKKQVDILNAANRSSKSISSENLDLTWWTKFYNSQLLQNNEKYSLKIYDKELENIPEFNRFKDWSGSYSLEKVKHHKKTAFVKKVYGAVKCQIQISSLVKTSKEFTIPMESQLFSTSNLLEIVVIVYVVQALNLTSRDIMSESDAYIVLTYGKQRVRDRAFYIPNQASPVFGRRFEMRGILPRDEMLHLSVYDRDFASSDDLIGSTTVDIEDRFRSKHLPSFGLPTHYTSRGYNKWRHQLKPSEMLLKLCEQHGVEKPRIKGGKIIVGGQEFGADFPLDAKECHTEQLCLLALNNFKHVASGFPLTPEHVETRSLYHPQRGGIEQGKVQLWIELYEPNQPHPLPLDITPQPPKPYELRLIVWNTADVILNERNIFGTEMSDIYVKCWLQEFTEAQYTDVHYRSLTGEGNFNWRMVFPFRYSPADGMLVIRGRKAFYEQYDTELKYPPVLTVQIWDNDAFSADDFLGTMELNLMRLPVPASSADACKLSQGLSLTGTGSGTGGRLNLFVERRVRGWFPVYGKNMSSIDATDQQCDVSLTGKIELELEILSNEDAVQNPVGVGRKPPQHLPEPLRPEVSFNWLRQPAKTFNKLLWPRVRKSFIWIGTVVLLCLLIYGLVVNLPTVFMVRSLEQRQSFERILSDG